MKTDNPRTPGWKDSWKGAAGVEPVWDAPTQPRLPAAQAEGVSDKYPLSLRTIFLQALLAWFVVRLALGALTVYAVASTQHAIPTIAQLVDAWHHWDGAWYPMIAINGYWVRAAAGFFPLYPLLIHTGTVIFGSGSAVVIAMLVNNLSSLAAFLGIGLLAAHETRTRGAAWRAIWITAAYPMAFYLVAPYSEGTFLALTIFAVYNARRGSWGWAAACGFLASLTRPTGIVLLAPLAWEFGRQHGWWRREVWTIAWWREAPQRLARLRVAPTLRAALLAVLVIGAVPAAFGCVVVYDAIHYHNAMMYIYAQNTFWHHAQWTVWQSVSAIISNIIHFPRTPRLLFLMAVDISAAVASVAIMLAAIRRLPVAFTLYMAALLYLLLTSPVPSHPEIIASAARYLLVAFPVVLILGRWTTRRPWLLILILCVGFVLQAIFARMFFSGAWIE